MSVKDQQICRLCLKEAKDEFEIDWIKREMLEVLLLKLNLNMTGNPIICQDCMEVAKKCLDFKYTCIATEQIILSYSAGRKNVKHDIKVIYQDKENEQTDFKGDFNVCRFCITPLETNNFFTLDALMRDSMFEILSRYIVEMDFNTIENPVTCTNCKKKLDSYFKFVLNCLNIEEKIKQYCKGKGTDNMGQVKLSNVLLFLYGDVLEYRDKSLQKCKIEQEHTESVSLEVYSGLIKQEKLDIKDEEMILEGTSYRNTSENMDEDKLSTFQVKQQHVLKNHISVYEEDNTSVDMGISSMYKDSLCGVEGKVHKDVSEIKMYKCSLCPFETKHKGNFNRHMLIHRDTSDLKMYKCSLCTYGSKRKSYLKKHMLVHKDISEIKMYKCSLCGYEAKQKDVFRRHALVHKDVSEIKMYKCSMCTYEAKQKYYLNKHMLVHKDISEIRMYKCSSCAYETSRKNNLTKHMLVHKDVSEIAMYRCSFCAYETKRKYTLIRHMTVHKGRSK